MRFLLQLIAKIDSPLLPHHFSHDFPLQFGLGGFNLHLTVVDDGRPVSFLNRFDPEFCSLQFWKKWKEKIK
jgi:hypothetical protein